MTTSAASETNSVSGNKFPELFAKASICLVEMSGLLLDLSFTEGQESKNKICISITELKRQVEQYAHAIISDLSKSTQTISAKQQLQSLSVIVNEIAGKILEAVNCIDFHKLKIVPDGTASLCALIQSCAHEISKAAEQIQKVGNTASLTVFSARIEKLDKEADLLFQKIKHNAEENIIDPGELLRHQNWLDKLENIMVSCEDFSYTLESR